MFIKLILDSWALRSKILAYILTESLIQYSNCQIAVLFRRLLSPQEVIFCGVLATWSAGLRGLSPRELRGGERRGAPAPAALLLWAVGRRSENRALARPELPYRPRPVVPVDA